MQVPVNWNNDYTYEDPSIVTPAQRELHFGQYDHVRYHGTDFPDRLRSAGFEVDDEDFLSSFSAAEKEYYRLPDREMIWRSNKPLSI